MTTSAAAATASSVTARPQVREPPVDPLVDRIRRRARASRTPPEADADPLDPSLERLLVDVVEHDLVAGLERDLGDPGAHRPGADDADDGAAVGLVRHGPHAARSDRLERLERLAAVAAVADRAALGRAEQVVHRGRSADAAVRADVGGSAGGANPAPPERVVPGRRDPVRSSTGRRTPKRTSTGRPKPASRSSTAARIDLERRAADERRQQLDPDRRPRATRPARPSRDRRSRRTGSPGPAPRRGRRGRPRGVDRPHAARDEPERSSRCDRLAHHVAPGSERRTDVNSPHSQRKASEWSVRPCTGSRVGRRHRQAEADKLGAIAARQRRSSSATGSARIPASPGWLVGERREAPSRRPARARRAPRAAARAAPRRAAASRSSHVPTCIRW